MKISKNFKITGEFLSCVCFLDTDALEMRSRLLFQYRPGFPEVVLMPPHLVYSQLAAFQSSQGRRHVGIQPPLTRVVFSARGNSCPLSFHIFVLAVLPHPPYDGLLLPYVWPRLPSVFNFQLRHVSWPHMHLLQGTICRDPTTISVRFGFTYWQ